MPFLECKEEKIGYTYAYRQEIEIELLRTVSKKRKGRLNDCKMIRIVSKTLRLSLLEATVLSWLLLNSPSLTFEGDVPMPSLSWSTSREDD